MSNERFYLVSENMLRDLLRDSDTLTALECGGVNNWEWHGYSIRDYVNNFMDNNPSLIPTDEEELEDFGIDNIVEFELNDFTTLDEFFNKSIETLMDH